MVDMSHQRRQSFSSMRSQPRSGVAVVLRRAQEWHNQCEEVAAVPSALGRGCGPQARSGVARGPLAPANVVCGCVGVWVWVCGWVGG